jgi:alkylation response protein AidB-like acyl-CoA dehydrogenase
MATEIDAARLLTLPRRLDERYGLDVNTRIRHGEILFLGIAVRVCNEAVQIHGGYGFMKDYPVEKFYRDVKLCTIGEGTSEIQRLVIARQLLKTK